MIKTSLKVKDNTAILDRLKDIADMQVYVGIPAERTERKSGPVQNAELLYIHTHGSPLKHIPARPVIEPAIEAKGNRAPIAEELGSAAKSVMEGQPTEATRHLKLAGMTGQNAARDWFEDPRNGWDPNTPITIARKGSDRPLIDTGQLRKSIIYVIKEKK